MASRFGTRCISVDARSVFFSREQAYFFRKHATCSQALRFGTRTQMTVAAKEWTVSADQNRPGSPESIAMKMPPAHPKLIKCPRSEFSNPPSLRAVLGLESLCLGTGSPLRSLLECAFWEFRTGET